jgi:stage V sporulation protein K
VGETEEKTSKVIESAHGGVLFIDEAYALADHYGEQKGFGEEATDCLVKKMEDKRGSLVVILAGYKQQTLEFMDINPGLKSRVPAIIDFPDYSIEELVEIAQRIVARRSLTLDSLAVSSLRTTLESEAKKAGFGNARTVENILEAAERNAVTRTSALGVLATEKELRTITSEDVPTTGDLASSEQKKNKFGFL